MVVPNYDDEVIEDYDEVVPSEDSARKPKVASGTGGPVQRPTREIKPSDKVKPGSAGNQRPATSMNPSPKPKSGAAARPAGIDPALGDLSPEEMAAATAGKGKITHSQAKLIWIICIGVCVLGVGAVAVHYFFFREPASGPVANNGPVNRPGLVPPKNTTEKTPHEKRADTFVIFVGQAMQKMNRSRAWDFFMVGKLKFQNSLDAALDAKKKEASQEEQERLWAETIKAWYEAKYRAAVVRAVYWDPSIEDLLTVNISDRKEVLGLRDQDLENEKFQIYQAAISKLDQQTAGIQKFQTDVIKYDLVAGRVFASEKWPPTWESEKKKWNAAGDSPPNIPQEDLDFCKGPNYGDGEKPEYEKMQG